MVAPVLDIKEKADYSRWFIGDFVDMDDVHLQIVVLSVNSVLRRRVEMKLGSCKEFPSHLGISEMQLASCDVDL